MLAIIDIDGTVSDNSQRLHLIESATPDWKAFLEPERVALDEPFHEAKRVIAKMLSVGVQICFLTGRNEGLREVTDQWLLKHFDLKVYHDSLLMREIGDNRLPTVYKRARISNLIYRFNPPYLAFDDDKYMMQVYRECGAMPFLAPMCWETMFVEDPSLPTEQYWRK